ncbi:unnamed protein product [Clonostachys chloroleuca]|uniref:Arrestin-like N-terminal domain-containing protein n=1 Tax=Clonostachys chloroleuca TaxID=1926264 RepID=A0AA35LQR5_9HYPO|nr:unnamed protein product [Clonostachys chloroleuca]
MPQATPQNSPALAVELEGDALWYQPGDVIIGRVVRRCSTKCQRAILTVSLHGKAKSKLANSETQRRGRYTLIVGSRNKQQLWNGPVHIPERGDQSWPFTFTLPTHADSRCLPVSVKENEKNSFVPFNNDVPLPASFSGTSTGESKEGFIEYYIEAEMQMHAHGTTTAVMPVRIERYNPGPPIQMRMNLLNTLHTVQGDSLVPGYSRDQLTTSQKFKKIFSSVPPPKLAFTLQTWFPITLQMDQSSHVPIKLRVVPKWDKTSEVLQDVLQTCRLRTLDIEIQTLVIIRCEGHLHPFDTEWKWCPKVQGSKQLGPRDTPVEIPFGHDSEPLDVGEVLNLRMKTTKDRREIMPFNVQQLHPEFTTYNIRTKNRIQGTVEVEVADKVIAAEIDREIKVFPPADDTGGPSGPAVDIIGATSSTWIQPPPPYEEPPNFEDQHGSEGNRRIEKNESVCPSILPDETGTPGLH